MTQEIKKHTRIEDEMVDSVYQTLFLFSVLHPNFDATNNIFPNFVIVFTGKIGPSTIKKYTEDFFEQLSLKIYNQFYKDKYNFDNDLFQYY